VRERNGVTIHRASHTSFSKRYMLLKAVSFVSFVMACRRRIHRVPQPDVIVFETDPFLMPFVADRLHRSTGYSMVGYLQDIYPDVAVALGKAHNGWLIRKLRSALFDVYKRCQRMIVLSSDMQQLLVADGISSETTCVIPNWADSDSFRPVDRDNVFLQRHSLEGKFVVMYSGNLGLTQRLEDFVEAAALLQGESDVHFVFIGQGARRADLERQVKDLGLANVSFFDYQPIEELAHILSAADLHLIPLNKALSQCLMPSKLYGILAAGRPYLTTAPEGGELFGITQDEQVGFTVPSGDPKKIADVILAARANSSELCAMRERARQLAESRFTKHHSVAAFANVLTEVV
ncbi:MAG: glycosyltransferase family 4 protein, partial [Fuerstiella sp.]